MKSKLLLYITFISVLRLAIFIFGSPVICPDTQSYIDLAKNIVNMDFSGFDGLRTPGYSIILILSGFNLKLTVLIQMIFGVAISYFIAAIVYDFTKREYLSILASAIYSVFIPFLFFETAVLSETTAAFSIVLSFFVFTRLILNKDKYMARILLISFSVLFAVLTRPVYMVMVPLYFIYFIMVFKRNNIKTMGYIKYLAAFIIPVVIPLLIWSSVNLKYNGTFSLATGRGYATMEMAGDYIHLGSDEYPYNIIKEVYIRERDKNIRNGAPHIDTIWGITGELQEKTGLSYHNLSEEVRKMCTDIMLKNPEIYFKSVIRSEINFWKTFGMLILSGSYTNNAIKYINIAQRLLLILFQIPFLVAPFVYFTKRKTMKKKSDITLVSSFTYILIVGISLLISIIECAEGRFAMPTFPLLIIVNFIFYQQVFAGQKSF